MATITLKFHGFPVEMQGTTTAKYAAKRLAEMTGKDPDSPWRLTCMGRFIPDEDIVQPLDEMKVGISLQPRYS